MNVLEFPSNFYQSKIKTLNDNVYIPNLSKLKS